MLGTMENCSYNTISSMSGQDNNFAMPGEWEKWVMCHPVSGRLPQRLSTPSRIRFSHESLCFGVKITFQMQWWRHHTRAHTKEIGERVLGRAHSVQVLKLVWLSLLTNWELPLFVSIFNQICVVHSLHVNLLLNHQFQFILTTFGSFNQWLSTCFCCIFDSRFDLRRVN